jgi:hypothetical protein
MPKVDEKALQNERQQIRKEERRKLIIEELGIIKRVLERERERDTHDKRTNVE